MADKDLGEELENIEEGIENLKNKEFRLFGIKVTPMTAMAALTAVGSLIGMLYGGFLMYQKVEQAIEFVDQQEEYQALMAGYDDRMKIIEVKLEEAVDYTRDIKNSLKDDIIRIETITERTSNRVKEVQDDIDERMRDLSDINREMEKDVRDSMREVENRIDSKMEKLDKDLRDTLQKVLDNPLSDN